MTSAASRSPCGSAARLHEIIGAIPAPDWTEIPYWLEGSADVAETTYVPFTSRRRKQAVRLIVRRVMPTPGSQLALQGIGYTYHAFITDREGATLDLETDHRRHAEIENTIRDVKYGMALTHMPSGRFAANAAWLGFNVIAHNLARWITRLGLQETLLTTKTVRTRFIALPGRLARTGRRLHLHLPANWPWQERLPGRAGEPGLTHHPDVHARVTAAATQACRDPASARSRADTHRVIRFDQPPPQPATESSLAVQPSTPR